MLYASTAILDIRLALFFPILQTCCHYRRLIIFVWRMYKKLIFLIIPTLLIFTSCLIKYHLGEFWECNDYDPGYNYLLNGLNLATWQPSYFFYHPGAPLQVAIALCLKVFQLTRGWSNDELIGYVLQHPDTASTALLTLFMVINSISLYISGWLVYRWSQNIAVAICIQASPLLSYISLVYCTMHLSPESFFLLTTIGLNAILVMLLYGKIDRSNSVILVSILAAFGISVKVHFLPVLIFPLLLSVKFRQLLYASIVIAVTFVICTLPISSYFLRAYQYASGIALNNAYRPDYNVPRPGLADGLINVAIMAVSNMPYAAIIIYSIYMLVFKRKTMLLNPDMQLSYRILLACVIFQLANVFSSAFTIALPHYIIPGILVSSVNLVVIVRYYALTPGYIKRVATFKYSFSGHLCLFSFCYPAAPLSFLQRWYQREVNGH